jgi:hypothetical protein
MPRAPRNFAGVGVERGEPSSHSIFPTAVADENFVLRNDGRHGDGLALIDVSLSRAPNLVARIGIDGHCLAIEEIEKIFPFDMAAPRFTTSQHATPCEAFAGLGSYFHFIAPRSRRSSA